MPPDEPEPAPGEDQVEVRPNGWTFMETGSMGFLFGFGGAISSLALSYALSLLGLLAGSGRALRSDGAGALGFAGIMVGPVVAGVAVGWNMRTALRAFLSALFGAAVISYPLAFLNALFLMSTSSHWTAGWFWLIYCVAFVIAAVVGGALRQVRDGRNTTLH